MIDTDNLRNAVIYFVNTSQPTSICISLLYITHTLLSVARLVTFMTKN